MIRSTTPDDSATLIALAVATGLFAEDETEALNKVLADYFSGNLGAGHKWIIDEEEGKPCGVAYYAPELIADRTWYLYMIAVHPDFQRQGRGMTLVQYVENELRSNGERLLLVETSALPQYDRARAFYKKCGFEEEARIRDFYTTGDDKIVFRKVLNVN